MSKEDIFSDRESAEVKFTSAWNKKIPRLSNQSMEEHNREYQKALDIVFSNSYYEKCVERYAEEVKKTDELAEKVKSLYGKSVKDPAPVQVEYYSMSDKFEDRVYAAFLAAFGSNLNSQC